MWSSSSALFYDCEFVDNLALCGGGAIACHGGGRHTPLFDSCILIGNSALDLESPLGVGGGGALECSGRSEPILYHCTLSANSAQLGSALYCYSSDTDDPFVTISNTIIAFNDGGAGIALSGNAYALLQCSNLYGNEGGDWIGGIENQHGATGNISGNPGFCGLPDVDIALHDSSPCAEAQNPECGQIGAMSIGCSGSLIAVNPNGPGSIQDAINSASDWDIVELTDGTFTGNGNRDIDFLGKRIVVRSYSQDPSTCVIDCQGTAENPHRAFWFQNGETCESMVCGIGIRHGYATNGGGGLKCASSPRIHYCWIYDNCSEQKGAGILCMSDGQTSLHGCLFFNNQAYGGGGGLAAANTARPVLSNCTMSNNDASPGAGIACGDSSECRLFDSIVAFNTSGEAVACIDSGHASLMHCDLYSNTGGDWTGCIAGQYDGRFEGNFQADPLFCLPSGDDYSLWNNSPCNQLCLVGALQVGCSVWAEVPQVANTHSGFKLNLSSLVRASARGNIVVFERTALPIRVSIHRLDGRIVATVYDGMITPGTHEIYWSGRDASNRMAASGIYYCHAQSGELAQTQRFVLVR